MYLGNEGKYFEKIERKNKNCNKKNKTNVNNKSNYSCIEKRYCLCQSNYFAIKEKKIQQQKQRNNINNRIEMYIVFIATVIVVVAGVVPIVVSVFFS